MDFKKLVVKHGLTVLGLACTVGGWFAETKGKASTVDKLDTRVEKLEKLVGEITNKKTD